MNLSPVLSNRALTASRPTPRGSSQTVLPPLPSPLRGETADPVDTFAVTPLVLGGALGAAVLGGSAALGAFYHDAGVGGAAALAGLSGALLGGVSNEDDPAVGAFVMGLGSAGVSAALAGLCNHIGPGFALAAGAVGAALGATLGYATQK